ncbi:MAG TPA: hydroxyisourate hydrolase [Chloroflexota bacterium]
MTRLSTHVLDTERGMPAAGVLVRLLRDDQALAHALTAADGRIGDLAGGAIEPGEYRLVFEVAAYFEAQQRTAPFLRRVSIEFAVGAADTHLHVPLLLSAYACTAYRGS